MQTVSLESRGGVCISQVVLETEGLPAELQQLPAVKDGSVITLSEAMRALEGAGVWDAQLINHTTAIQQGTHTFTNTKAMVFIPKAKAGGRKPKKLKTGWRL